MPVEDNVNFVFVRNRKTGDIDVCRANEFSRRLMARPSNTKRSLHYIDRSRTRVCRCEDPKRHHGPISEVASDSAHLNASIELYMTRHDIRSCNVADFWRYQAQRKTFWARYGIIIDDFHYMSREKDVVCRCSKFITHSLGVPRNPQIIEQCAKFFLKKRDLETCSKSQWQGVEEPLFLESLSESWHGTLEYDSQSIVPFLQGRATPQQQRSVSQHAPRSLGTETPRDGQCIEPTEKQHNQNERLIESNVPEQVWQNARPSAWHSQCSSESTVSTPLGTYPSYEMDTIPTLSLFTILSQSCIERHLLVNYSA